LRLLRISFASAAFGLPGSGSTNFWSMVLALAEFPEPRRMIPS
jgi:hypothetical protein